MFLFDGALKNINININLKVYSNELPKTNKIQASIHISIAVNPSAFGELVVMLLKILIRTRNKVIKRAIRPKTDRNNTYPNNGNVKLCISNLEQCPEGLEMRSKIQPRTIQTANSKLWCTTWRDVQDSSGVKIFISVKIQYLNVAKSPNHFKSSQRVISQSSG